MSGFHFWTSNIIPLLIVVLHFLREHCTPEIYQKRFVLFYDHGKAAQPIHSPLALLKYNSTIARDHIAEDVNGVLYEDDHLVILSKEKVSSRPKQLLAYRIASYKRFEQHSSGTVMWQFSVAATIYLVQCFLFHKAATVTIQMMETRLLDRILAAASLLLPMALIVLSSLYLATAINMAADYPGGLSWIAEFYVVRVLGYMLFFSWPSFLIAFWRIIVTSSA